MKNNLIYIAKITKPHGVRGDAKLISYSEVPDDIFNYPCLYDEKQNEYKLKCKSKNANIFIITINNITCRTAIENLAGTKLYIAREALPESSDDECYLNDLINVEILDADKKLQGHILQMHNFGAGDIIEMKIIDSEKTIYLPFEVISRM